MSPLLSAGIALAASLLAIFMVPETLPEHVRVEARLQQSKRGAKAQRCARRKTTISSKPFASWGHLIEQYGLNRHHPAIRQAADFFFAHQTSEGDFRGIYGTQYSPNYSAAIMELLVKAGYENDPRIEAGFRWLLGLRQRDGGWTLPLRTVGKIFDRATLPADPIRPDTTRPSSHLITGVVLRAFAAHAVYRRSREAQAAGAFLASHLFPADVYPDRRAPGYWTTFSYPF